MFTYSIEQNTENIYHHKTREYFQEVLQSYVSGSYRSAVVMLYSVVMCDLIYKLQDLKELYNDPTAQSILDKIEQEQKKNPDSGSWESVLINEVKSRTYLLEQSEKVGLDSLRSHRHLSAHPVLNQQDLLSTPNQETVRALIRNMLEGLLIKNPVMSKKVFHTIVEDMEQHKNFFSDEDSLERYLESRFLKNTNEQTVNDIFKSLWSITFNNTDERCEANRDINFRALRIIYKKHKTSIVQFIGENTIPFNNIIETEHSILIKLTEFFNDYPELYDFMESHTQTKLVSAIEKKNSYKVRSAFLRGSMKEHIEYLRRIFHNSEPSYHGEVFSIQYLLEPEDKRLLKRWATDNSCLESYYHLLIDQYVHSGNFATADRLFDYHISSILEELNGEHFIALFEGIKDNTQLHWRGNASLENTKIKRYADKVLGTDFDYEDKFPLVEFEEED